STAAATAELYALSLHDALPIYAPGQPCGVVFTTTGEGNGTDSDAALNAAYTKAAVAAGLICARNTNGCDATEFVQYQKVSFGGTDRKSTRLNSSHVAISYAVFC